MKFTKYLIGMILPLIISSILVYGGLSQFDMEKMKQLSTRDNIARIVHTLVFANGLYFASLVFNYLLTSANKADILMGFQVLAVITLFFNGIAYMLKKSTTDDKMKNMSNFDYYYTINIYSFSFVASLLYVLLL